MLRFPVSLVFSLPVTVIYQSFVGVTFYSLSRAFWLVFSCLSEFTSFLEVKF